MFEREKSEADTLDDFLCAHAVAYNRQSEAVSFIDDSAFQRPRETGIDLDEAGTRLLEATNILSCVRLVVNLQESVTPKRTIALENLPRIEITRHREAGGFTSLLLRNEPGESIARITQ